MQPIIRKLVSFVAAMAALIATFTLPSASPMYAAPSTTFVGAYSIEMLHGNGRRLDATGCSPDAGTRIQLWNFSGGDCQQWFIEPTDSGFYRIRSKNGGRALDALGCTPDGGTRIQLWDYWGGDCQQWRIEATDWDRRIYKITSKNGGRALDALGCAPNDGVPIQLWDYWGGDCQQWIIEPITQPAILYFPSPMYSGDCEMYIAQVHFDVDGRGWFYSRTLTRKTHSGDTWHINIDVKDQNGTTLFSLGQWDSPRMDEHDPNVGSNNPGDYTFQESFTYDPALFTRISGATAHSSC